MTWLTWSILSALFAAATAILAKLGVTGIDSNVATAVRTFVVLLVAWLIVVGNGKASSVLEMSGRSWMFLILSGVATGLSWLCYFRALQLGQASKVVPIDRLSLVFVILAAAVFLGERISLSTGIGVAMVIGGVLILAMS